MDSLQLLYPEILLSVLALLLLTADLWIGEKHGHSLYHLGMICAALTLGMVGFSYSDPARLQSGAVALANAGPGTLFVVDPMSLFFKVLILVTTILALLLTLDFNSSSKAHLGSFSALILFSALGMMLLVSAVDLLLIFLCLELVSISSFILAGFERKDVRSSEGAIKYFLIGAFSAAIMVFGISLFYGATGTTRLLGLRADPTPMLMFGVLLMVVGFGFKASVAPFHLWVADAYEGAPTPVTAFLSVAPKIAALAAILRVFGTLVPVADFQLTALFSFLAMLTMTVGNLTAIFQTNVKRLLAYSSVAQAGYMLIGFVAGGSLGAEALMFYSLTYIFMNIGAFAVAILVGNQEGYELECYDGLAKRNLGLALLMTFFLLSLAGIPPMAGFIAKLYVFGAAMEQKLYALALVGVLNSVVSVYYYLRITYHMFFRPARTEEPLVPSLYLYSGLTVAALGVIILGLYPNPFIETVKMSAEMVAVPSRLPVGLAGK